MLKSARRLASIFVLLALVAGVAGPTAHASTHARQGQVHSARSHADGLSRPDAADDLGCSLVTAPLSACSIARAQVFRTVLPRFIVVPSRPDHTPDQHGVDPVAPTRGPPAYSA